MSDVLLAPDLSDSAPTISPMVAVDLIDQLCMAPPMDATYGTTDPLWPGILATAGSDLIYRSASGLERAEADVDGPRLMAVYAELVRDQWDPYAISYRNLPFLAWAMGVNLWEEDWDEAFRRYWVANQWTLQSQRGSLLGISNFMQAVGGEVIRAITPPARFYPEPATTPAQTAAYVARFPQLRIYPYAPTPQMPYLCFMGGFSLTPTGDKIYSKNGSFLPFSPTNYNAGGDYFQKVTLWDRGVEIPLTIQEWTSVDAGTQEVTIYDQVVLPARQDNHYYMKQTGKFFLPKGHPLSQNKHGIFLGSLNATASRLINVPKDGSLDLMEAKAIYQTITPSIAPLQVAPEYVATEHPIRQAEFYCAPSSGAPATGIIKFDVNHLPLPGDMITIGKTIVVWGLVNAPAIGSSLGASLGNLMNYLNASVDGSIDQCTYNYSPNSLNVISKATGVDGNGFLLGCSTLGASINGSTAAARSNPAFGALSGGYGGPMISPQPLVRNNFLPTFLPKSNAWQFLYQRWYLFDPTRVPDYKKASVFMGVARFGIQPYTAELQIQAYGNWPRYYMRAGGFMRGYLPPANTKIIDKLRRAVTASMSLRDTVLINTACQRTVQVSDAVLCDGNTSVGEYITSF